MLYQSAADIIEKRREERRRLIEERKLEIYSKIPKIAEIEARLSATGMSLLSAVAEEKLSPDDAVEKIMAENRALEVEKTKLLISHGYGAGYLSPPYVCSKCSDTGFDETGALCSCLSGALTDAALKEANLTRHMAGQTFDRFLLSYYDNDNKNGIGIGARDNAKNVFDVALSFAENFDYTEKNLLFYGPSGLGKTFLSSAIAHYLLNTGKDVLYISANSLFPMLEDLHFGRGDEKSAYTAEKALSCDLLILDDLGAEFVTQFTASELFRIVNQRLLEGRKMVFSTNLSLSDIAGVYTERIVSRLIGSFETLQFFGEDIRKKKKYSTTA